MTRHTSVHTTSSSDIVVAFAANVVMTGMSTGDGDVDYNAGNCNVMVTPLPSFVSYIGSQQMQMPINCERQTVPTDVSVTEHILQYI